MIFSPLQSRSLGTSHSSSNRHYLPHRIFLNLTDGLKSLFCQRWFYFWEKPEVAGCQIWAVRGLSHLGDLMFHQKTLHEMQCVSGRGWSCQSPVAHSCSLLNHPNSFCRATFRLHAKFDADSLLYSLSHFERDGYTYTYLLTSVYCPLWLVQWSHHCSSPFPLYIDVEQTILLILTMAGLFLDRLCMYIL